MSGHSKWHNIQHKKGLADAKRGKMFSKLIKELTVAVKKGNSGDVNANPRLRLAVINARGANMPKDTIERAIAKALGQGGANFEEITFEAYGPSGEALYLECTTDNKTRTVGNIRSYLNKFGGNLGKDGCLQFVFERKGNFIVKADTLSGDQLDEITLELIDAGAEEVEQEDGCLLITTSRDGFGSVQKKLADLNLEVQEANLEMIPNTTKDLSAEAYQKFLKLLDLMEDDEDVQKVYHNVTPQETAPEE